MTGLPPCPHCGAPAQGSGDCGAWQPIETVPKDGTWFLICNADDDRDAYEVGCYDPYMTTDYVETEPGSDLYRRERRSSYDWTGFNNFHRATHWMPILTRPSPSLTSTHCGSGK